jgi:hypothetical protein
MASVETSRELPSERVGLPNKMVEAVKRMTRSATIAWLLFGIAGSLCLLVGAGMTALVGFTFSIDAPHAWKGDPRIGLAAASIAFGLLGLAALLARRSLASLRGLGRERTGRDEATRKSS